MDCSLYFLFFKLFTYIFDNILEWDVHNVSNDVTFEEIIVFPLVFMFLTLIMDWITSLTLCFTWCLWSKIALNGISGLSNFCSLYSLGKWEPIGLIVSYKFEGTTCWSLNVFKNIVSSFSIILLIFSLGILDYQSRFYSSCQCSLFCLVGQLLFFFQVS